MKIWRIKKSRSRTVLHGCFLARVIVTWIHFLLNEPKECESIDKDVRVPFLSIKFSLYIYNYDETGIARFWNQSLMLP